MIFTDFKVETDGKQQEVEICYLFIIYIHKKVLDFLKVLFIFYNSSINNNNISITTLRNNYNS